MKKEGKEEEGGGKVVDNSLPATPNEDSSCPTTTPSDDKNEAKHGMTTEADDGYSIVQCLPITGRTHQLRVHLQFLGHPIVNDPIYCNQRVFGPDLGYRDASASADEDIIARLSRMGKDQVAEAVAYHEEITEEYNKRKAEKMSGLKCDVCHTPLYSEPGMHEMGIYLHAKRYAANDGSWAFETELPRWALPPSPPPPPPLCCTTIDGSVDGDGGDGSDSNSSTTSSREH